MAYFLVCFNVSRLPEFGNTVSGTFLASVGQGAQCNPVRFAATLRAAAAGRYSDGANGASRSAGRCRGNVDLEFARTGKSQ
jgi:hypothetical protein